MTSSTWEYTGHRGPANLVRDASCWQREHEWWQDTAVVTKWLSGVSPLRILLVAFLKIHSSFKPDFNF
ncbi:hypothetical protein Q3G72_015735 [Acer saccharum]|nr:hypothetical protein Q3G72_015735 [Acer saccharum]